MKAYCREWTPDDCPCCGKPLDKVEVIISEVMPDNCIKLADTYYRKVGDNHPAATVIEEGHFGNKVFKQVPTRIYKGVEKWDW
jgi:hypothetical protein